MAKTFLFLLALGLVAWGIGLARKLAAGSTERRQARLAWFARLPTEAVVADQRTEPTGFPRLSAHWQGRPFDLRVVPDALSMRKLPALWLLVTLTAPGPAKGEVRFMARASGQESFSHFSDLPFAVQAPPGLPAHVSPRATGPEALPGPEALAMIAGLFADPRLKEVVVGEKGLRMVWLVEEADRGRYLIYREAELGHDPPDAALFTRLFTDLVALEDCIAHGR